jgi:hypothetical protein
MLVIMWIQKIKNRTTQGIEKGKGAIIVINWRNSIPTDNPMTNIFGNEACLDFISGCAIVVVVVVVVVRGEQDVIRLRVEIRQSLW